METPSGGQPAPISTAKILVGALMMGLITASGVFFFLGQQGTIKPQSGLDILLVGLAALWPSTAALAVVMKGVMIKQARAEWDGNGGDDQQLMTRYLSMTIVRAALLEGSGLFGAVAFMLTGNALALIAPALSLAGLSLMFPSENKYRDFARGVTGQL